MPSVSRLKAGGEFSAQHLQRFFVLPNNIFDAQLKVPVDQNDRQGPTSRARWEDRSAANLVQKDHPSDNRRNLPGCGI